MKKFKYLVLALVAIVFITGCTNKSEYINYVTTDEIKTAIEAKESFVLNITSASCSACQSLEPRLVAFLNENKISVKRIDIAKFNSEQIAELSGVISFTVTPTIAFIKDGVEETQATRIIGAVSNDKLNSQFKSMGYITE